MCGFCMRVSRDRLATVENLEAVVTHLSNEMSGLVNATVDARLDRLGTLGGSTASVAVGGGGSSRPGKNSLDHVRGFSGTV